MQSPKEDSVHKVITVFVKKLSSLCSLFIHYWVCEVFQAERNLKKEKYTISTKVRTSLDMLLKQQRKQITSLYTSYLYKDIIDKTFTGKFNASQTLKTLIFLNLHYI